MTFLWVLFAGHVAIGDVAVSGSDFVGTWRRRNGTRTTVVTWNGNGTWQSKTTGGTFVLSLSGVWWVKDGKHHGVFLKSSDPRVPLGELESEKIREVTDSSYVIVGRKGRPLKYFRVGSKVEDAPTEFEMQILEPLGGKILRPKGWFYTEQHGGPSYSWILSREDPSKSEYETGVRIQTFVGVEDGTGMSPREFVLDQISHRKRNANAIHKTCEPNDQGLFTHISLETDEGEYRILYSFFWGNNVDAVVLSTARTKKNRWVNYSDVFDMMSSFELVDMDRLMKEDGEQSAAGDSESGTPEP